MARLGVWRGGEVEADDGATVGVVRRPHVAAVAFDGLLHDREAEPRAGLRARFDRSVEAVEHVREVVGWDAGSVVAHLEAGAGDRDLDAAGVGCT